MATKNYERIKRETNRHLKLPGSIRQQRGHVPGEIIREQGERLAFRTGQVCPHSDERKTRHRFIEQHFARGPFPSRHLHLHRESKITHGERIGRSEAEFVPLVAGDGSRNNNVAVVMRCQFESGIALEFLPELRGHGIGQPWFQGFIDEWNDLDRMV